MDNDDAPVGRILPRREVLTLFGGVGLALLVGCAGDDPEGAPSTATASATAPLFAATPTAGAATATATAAATAGVSVPLPSCIAVPEMTEGPYFVDEQLDRSDVRESVAGVPLDLVVNVSHVTGDGCAALTGAVVDIWQCDASGQYSDVTDRAVGFDTTGKTFLRGLQRSDAAGQTRFTTIYPGWYPGRAVHIHFKVRAQAADGSIFEFTSQFFFDDALSDEVLVAAPYAKAGRRTRNADDGIYRSGGDQLVLAARPAAEGFSATFDLGLQV
ncbi:MAG: intradiol ring-cleavage dioxygenase [Chloroflexi bacterium]|nr:intradiol ring-cleavage dioxygenase [Chloroflexota bacterium]MDA1146973.1 intradiol ring-cleavage dioxygenase [Chloroflexota bacterium]